MRLDNYLVMKKFFSSRTKAKQAIERGEIFIFGKNIDKPSYEIDEVDTIDIERRCVEDYVSLGGYKLIKALKDFNFSVLNMICVDLGASTGGFTDCLLKNGAKKVYAVDLNDTLLDKRLKDSDKVKAIIKNARYIEKSDFEDSIDLVVADLSFISINFILPIIYNILPQEGYSIILIKPQFETGEKRRFKNGIIRDKLIHKNVCSSVYSNAVNCGFLPQKLTLAPNGQEKNSEFLLLLKKGKGEFINFDELYKNI